MAIEEAWLRGPLADIDPLVAPILYSFTQAREDLAKYTERLTTEQIWSTPHGFGSVGFHIRHIAGSTDRLMTYLKGDRLSDAQMDALRDEETPGWTREQLLKNLDAAFARAENSVRQIDPAVLAEPRYVGRKLLPTTVIGLLTHIAEHTQRHVGQAVISAKWAAKLARGLSDVTGNNAPPA